MSKLIKYLILLLVSLSLTLLNSSCSTLVYGTKDKIQIESDQTDVDFKLNHEPIYLESNQFKLKKSKKDKVIVASKEGFDSQSIKLDLLDPSILSPSIFFLAPGAGIIAGGIPMYGEYPMAGGIMLGVGGLFIASAIVDGITKAHKTYGLEKIRFDLIKSVPELDGDEFDKISCSSVNVKISPGEEIGNKFTLQKRKFKPEKKFRWEESSNVKVEDLSVQVNNDLDDFGLPVPGLSNKFDKNTNERYSIRADVTALEIDYYENLIAIGIDPDTYIGCEMKVEWAVYDNRLKKIIFDEVVETYLFKNDNSVKTIILNSISNSLQRLITETDILEQIQKTKDKKPTYENDEEIKISTDSDSKNLNQSIESVFTIDMGDSHGSGFIISKDGYALTNSHVVNDEDEVEIVLNNGISLSADVIRVNKSSDIALLKIKGKGLPSLSITTEETTVGSNVTAIGTPADISLGQSVSKGTLSGIRIKDDGTFLQTDVSVSFGSSGGPLLNDQNKAIGIITSKIIGKGIEGVGFAIPMQTAISSLNLLIE